MRGAVCGGEPLRPSEQRRALLAKSRLPPIALGKGVLEAEAVAWIPTGGDTDCGQSTGGGWMKGEGGRPGVHSSMAASTGVCRD